MPRPDARRRASDGPSRPRGPPARPVRARGRTRASGVRRDRPFPGAPGARAAGNTPARAPMSASGSTATTGVHRPSTRRAGRRRRERRDTGGGRPIRSDGNEPRLDPAENGHAREENEAAEESPRLGTPAIVPAPGETALRRLSGCELRTLRSCGARDAARRASVLSPEASRPFSSRRSEEGRRRGSSGSRRSSPCFRPGPRTRSAGHRAPRSS